MEIERIGTMLCGVGESPVWHPGEQVLYWTDIPARMLWRWSPSERKAASWVLPEQAGCLAMRKAGGLLLAMEQGIGALERLPDAGQAAEPALVAAVRHAAPGMRFNDGRCDRQGRFWAGTMVQDMSQVRPAGRIYRFTQGELRMSALGEFVTPNGMGFSPDGRTLYLSDSHPSRQTVWAYDYDADAGRPGRRRVFIEKLPAGRPDGAAVDADGCYWICGNDAGMLYRYTPGGRLDRSIALPVAKPAMCAFGGAGLDTLFITTIRPPSCAPDAPDGAVYALRPGARGLQESACAG
ncbi:SMP-30/gluconolactonase/LRE family protein [Bordetella sp. FB-8]|uniref:SMP-30/gluconolactonase/LRE family protein n=1 Tax=Bordetella sp. FB-8 TaxID=1159870 RepID=UPI000382A21B|nr:SMP-30/gluconolactonase/LRE family protein [Bordetella sp. FB-8]